MQNYHKFFILKFYYFSLISKQNFMIFPVFNNLSKTFLEQISLLKIGNCSSRSFFKMAQFSLFTIRFHSKEFRKIL